MKTSKYFWIGFVFIMTGLLFFGGMMYIQDISLQKSNYTFTVLFDNVQGLNVGDQVDMLGKKIGKVSQTKIMSQKIEVELSIDNSFAFSIPVDSKIEVKSEGLIGSKFISITPGLNRKDYILPGSTVEGLKLFDISEITPGILPLTQDLSAFARQLKSTLGEEEKENIRSIINNIESFTVSLDTLIYNNRNVISSNDKKNFQDFMKNLNGAVKDLKYGINKEISKIDGILDDITKISSKSGEMGEAIIEIKNASLTISKITSKLDRVLDKIEKSDGTYKKFIEDPSLYDNMNVLVDEIKNLIEDFKNNPTKYMKAYWKGKK